jgi:hypothetical protein
MKRTLQITYGNAFTINKGDYENEKPLYSQTTTIELGKDETFDEQAEYQRLKSIVDPLATEHFMRSKIEASGLRIRVKDGRKYVSVTSITGGGKPYRGDPEYGTRGTELHSVCDEFIDTGIWREPSVPLVKLKYEDIKYKEFFESFKDRLDFVGHEKEIEVFNDEHLYSGRLDIICKVDGIKTLADLKTGGWGWEQIVAYYKAKADNEIKQLAVFDLKKAKLEVIKVTDPKAKQAWENFLKMRGKIEAIYGV